jgi:cytochrome c
MIALATLLGVRGGQHLSWARATGQAARGQTPDKATNGTGDAAEKLIKNSDCGSCHAVDRQLVGPSYNAIAQKYAGQSGVEDKLVKKIKDGGAGSWGNVPMTVHSDLSDAKLKAMVQWVLAQKAAPAKARTVVKTYEYVVKTYEYKDKAGKPVTLDFPVFVEGSGRKVTKDIFKGYELYNSYCYRCHGQDATESELAPDLKRSLNQGMDEKRFLSTAMAGKEDKGMPAWAGFFSEQEIKQIYMYVKGRSLDLVPVGRPPAEGE